MWVWSVADPEFPRNISRERGANLFIVLQNFCRKLNENERIWTEGGALC